jgi:RNA polymerase sigma factor (sigma-70 family)
VNQYAILIKEAISGNRISQSKLYSLLAPKMFATCLWYAKNRPEAEDIMQEGFLKVFKYLHQYKSTGPLESWVKKIIIRTAIDKIKSSKQLHAFVNISDATEDIEDNYAAEEIIERIGTKKLIEISQSLPPMYRMVFNLYVFEGLKHKEIAELLNITEGTSKSNLFDARKILQKKLKSCLDEELKQTV